VVDIWNRLPEEIIVAKTVEELEIGNNFIYSKLIFFINPAVSEANMVDTCKHFEIGSGSLSHLPVFVIEHKGIGGNG
jgi:hypothetical protein